MDGGNSKTDAALVAADGSVLAAVRGPGMPTADLDGSLRVISDLIERIGPEAGQPGRPAARHICACVANADLPEEEVQLAAAIRAGGWSQTTTVVNDTFAVLRAGLTADGAGRPWGVAVTCGAGINCVGVAEGGETFRYLALGSISGDWGGGYGLGRAALWWAIRAEDGRGPQTELRAAVAAHFGVDRVEDAVVGLQLGKIDHAEVHGLVPVLFTVAGHGDEVARSVVLRQADEVCLMATVAARRLGLAGDGGSPVPVVLGGSLMTARDPLLSGAIREQLAVSIPGADVRIVDVPPIAGAALLGLDQVAAGPDAAARLRASAAATW
jgi:N-acetylglucosamine kinase-like BadF-type ATPase